MVVGTITTVGIGCIIQAWKHTNRFRRDADDQKPKPDPENIPHLQTLSQVLAWLVYSVRFHDPEFQRQRKVTTEEVTKWETDLGFEEIDYFAFTAQGKSEIQEDVGGGKSHDHVQKDVCQGLARLFRKKNGVATHRVQGLPKYVFAIRGTRGTRDSPNNMEIFVGTLWSSNECEPVLNVIQKVHELEGSVDSLCITGHSQGAYLALLGGLCAANPPQGHDSIEGVVLHLFNPPFVSVDIVTKKLCIDVFSGLSEIPSAIGLKRLAKLTRETGELFVGAALKIGDLAVSTFSDSSSRKKEEILWQQEMLYEKELKAHVYVNRHDPICNEYIAYLEDRTALTATVGSFLSKGARPMHLICRTAELYINDEGLGLRAGHQLKQWTYFK